MEDKLSDARSRINEIDAKMAELFLERIEAVEDVAEYKKERGLAIFDANREKEVLARNLERIEDVQKQSYYVEFQKNVMNVFKQYQRKLVEGVKVAYCGVEGAFAQIAAKNIFPEAELVAYKDFADTYAAVENGDVECAVLPLENSFAGEVGTVMDLMFKGSLYVNAIHTFRVNHNLLGTKDSSIDTVKSVMSHPQALEQCSGYIKAHGFEKIQAVNTAEAAKIISEKNDPAIAAIGSKEAGELYGLKILDHDINESDDNSTRFGVFSRQSAQREEGIKANHIIMMFTVKNEAGALAKAMNVIGAYGYNMSSVRSRPMHSLAWQYYFYVEATGDGTKENEKRMLQALRATCDRLKVLGSFEWSER